MVDCVIKDWQGADAGTATLDLSVAKEDNAAHIVHRAIVRQMHNSRQGTLSSKTRSEVRGGGRKPWRQKGTGRARAGSNRSPLWRGGGVIFGPKPRDFDVKMNRKERRLALRTAFQSRVDDMVVVENFADQLSAPKTKEVLSALERWGVDVEQKVLMITAEKNEVVYRSVRNVANIKLILATNLNAYDIVLADKLVVTATALEKIQEVYSA
ncbi:50S ribosomal protein L4 [Leptolyngbyaceae cyanobacterium CCMR0082]|uniref:Large ribosomal subunit protein uL4 n=2 Tax=Adonisia turfae TaxID=2950184 RepID=A0A6M0S3E6_9CYAN|nr:50S ribosomal protein L4 [Adonisia turfae]MDV3351815.1 50S ribosomal protein L4 [Leptothoe sp. LEGE 181152]NEZ60547.1 50S ribosomal protein L4 [Adonisia turfae CCMR0081]NEZ62938.1 50S ribosomal protein L4 [Adonisia turfae CCMR0082]